MADEKVLAIASYASIIIDVTIIMISLIVIKIIRSGPSFLLKIVLLTFSACATDLIVNLCMLNVQWPS